MNFKRSLSSFLLIGLAGLCTSLPSYLWAEKRQVSALDILNLPHENRKLAALESDSSLFFELRNLSLNPQQSMQVRWRALMLMVEMNPKASIPELLNAKTNSAWYMRNAALLGLEQIQKSKAVDAARELIKDKALVVRSAAVEVLSRNFHPSLRELFWQEFSKQYNFRKNRSLWIRGQILKALAQDPLDRESRVFAQLINEKEPLLQAASVTALEKIHGLKLGDTTTPHLQKIGLWQEFVRKKNLAL